MLDVVGGIDDRRPHLAKRVELQALLGSADEQLAGARSAVQVADLNLAAELNRLSLSRSG